MELMFNIFMTVVVIGGLFVAYMCGHTDGCKTNACFRSGGSDNKEK